MADLKIKRNGWMIFSYSKYFVYIYKCSKITGHGSHTKGRMHTGGIRKGKEI
jgi:hypothetical protein